LVMPRVARAWAVAMPAMPAPQMTTSLVLVMREWYRGG
jgi:hypothetical protein